MNGYQADKGFTLIELMVTLAVLAIIISLGVPMYGQFTQGSHLTSRTSELVSAINIARSEAVSRRLDVTLAAIDGDWTNGWEVTDNGGVLLRRDDYRDADVGYDVAAFRAADGADIFQLVFGAQGRATVATGFTVCLRDAASRARNPANAGRALQVNIFGRVRTFNVNAADAPADLTCE